jgi:RNase H-fold protein (predicted Holliday junction resolvase)
VIAVDPGRAKCGVAVLAGDGTILDRAIVLTETLHSYVVEQVRRFAPVAVIVGQGTGSAPVIAALRSRCGDVPVIPVDEAHTSELARARYLAEVPATGLRRLLPHFLRSPEQPYDDFVAVILAERWLKNQAESR